ncbi:heme NO-binding domain-containing protein [Paracoccus saliphilus]|uniref:Haem-NO-binding n=1 Tax=Paracoccus saliphilus TaxID=405559 RepID=A0AA46A533_9RHOB|nr:heme NO-binding domain-containing protein [Paracoccus saliphilus]WCR04912.1 heme NO-binding domain-containing protein [Paracoccus saliphilus]SIS72700.1 Haem-NO-binding [Paracoccus saliphilus]
MHWLVRKFIESFLRETYSDALWHRVCRSSGVASYRSSIDDLNSQDLIAMAAQMLGKPKDDLLEDLGAWSARQERIRRLLRFSGRNFHDFLLNLEMLGDRVRMIAPDFLMPRIRVTEDGIDCLRVDFPSDGHEWACAMAGLIRCMADDYGALGVIGIEENSVTVQISDGFFTSGRSFLLGENEEPAR